MQGFDENKITSGIKGDLRQEFWELEILEEITRLHFAGKLPGTVTSVYRCELLWSYKLCTCGKALANIPHIHPVLHYNDALDNNNEITEYSEWMLLSKPQTKRKATATLDCSPTKKMSNTFQRSWGRCTWVQCTLTLQSWARWVPHTSKLHTIAFRHHLGPHQPQLRVWFFVYLSDTSEGREPSIAWYGQWH
jgi:hypothetical protein